MEWIECNKNIVGASEISGRAVFLLYYQIFGYTIAFMDGLTGSIRMAWLAAAAAGAVLAAGWVSSGYAVSGNGRQIADANLPALTSSPKIAAVIDCHGMIDEGLYQSIVRRSEEAIAAGADYLFYDIQTYGGRVDSADEISKYLIHDVRPMAHTVAYISKEAISAGAMVSVSCKDILMRRHTTIGASAPMSMGGTLEGVEREKIESYVRSVFSRAAEANGYPEALLKAMVTRQLEVWQVKNRTTGQMEFFETEHLPTDPNTYDLKNKHLIVKDDEILTLTDSKAYEYGIARAVVENLDEALAFLAERDGVVFDPKVLFFKPLWSEQMVRWINSPAVVSVLVLGILLGIYVEMNTPGLGLPSLLAILCLVVLVGSRYLTGMANWIEIAILVIGIVLLLVEFFILPGFGVAGFLGITCILIGLFGMLVRTAPGEIPWPKNPAAWQEFTDGLMGIAVGFAAFLVAVLVLSRYMDRIPLFRSFVLSSALDRPGRSDAAVASKENAAVPAATALGPGQIGRTISVLRPAGKARFDDTIADVVTRGEFLGKDISVTILEIRGNRIVVAAEQWET